MLLALKEMLYYSMITVSILTVPMLIIGIIFSVIQAATQVNEMTLTFIPKMLVMFTLLLLLTPWLMEHLVNITRHMLTHLPQYLR
jgi:flagellar biosynthetic protein FliQ